MAAATTQKYVRPNRTANDHRNAKGIRVVSTATNPRKLSDLP